MNVVHVVHGTFSSIAQQFQVFPPAPPIPSQLGSPTLSGCAGSSKRELGAAQCAHEAPHSAQKFSSVRWGFAPHVSRVQEPRSDVFRSLARQFGTSQTGRMGHWGRSSTPGRTTNNKSGPVRLGRMEERVAEEPASSAPTRPSCVTKRGGARSEHDCRS